MLNIFISRQMQLGYDLSHSHLHLCEGVVSFEENHVIVAQLQVRVVAFEIMWIVVGLVVG